MEGKLTLEHLIRQEGKAPAQSGAEGSWGTGACRPGEEGCGEVEPGAARASPHDLSSLPCTPASLCPAAARCARDPSSSPVLYFLPQPPVPRLPVLLPDFGSEPAYSLLIKGRVRCARASWAARGATEADYHLHKVGVVFHSRRALLDVAGRWTTARRAGTARTACPWRWPGCPGPVRTAGRRLSVTARRLGFTMHEAHFQAACSAACSPSPGPRLAWWRSSTWGTSIPTGAERAALSPTGYQRPLQSAPGESGAQGG